MEQKLPLREKCFLGVFSLLIFLASAYGAIASKSASFNAKGALFSSKSYVVLEISGEVKKPGSYAFPIGSTWREVFHKVRMKRFADLQNFSLEEPLLHAKKVVIPKLEKLEIFLEGAVRNPGKFFIPTGTKVRQLKKMDVFLPDAEKKILSQSRYLQNGERFFIPFQEKKKQSLEIN